MAKARHSYLSSAFDILSVELDAKQDEGAPSTPEPAVKAAVPASLSLPATIKKPKVNFDFGKMPAKYQTKIRRLERDLDETLTTAIIHLGEKLLAIKEIIEKHSERGTWSRYLETGLPFSETSARNYIHAAEAVQSFSATVAEKLPPTVLYSARHAPDEVRQEITRRSSLGEVVTGGDVERMIEDYGDTQACREMVHTSREANPDDVIHPTSDHHATEVGQAVGMASTSLMSSVEAVSADTHVIAAAELIARLISYFEKGEISDLNKLWRCAGYDAVEQQLRIRDRTVGFGAGR